MVLIEHSSFPGRSRVSLAQMIMGVMRSVHPRRGFQIPSISTQVEAGTSEIACRSWISDIEEIENLCRR